MSIVTIRAPKSAALPQFTNQPATVEYWGDGRTLSLEGNDEGKYWIENECGGVETFFGPESDNQEYTREAAIWLLIAWSLLGVKLKGHNAKRKSFNGDNETDRLEGWRRQKLIEVVAQDHGIRL